MADLSFLDPVQTDSTASTPLEAAAPDLSFLDPPAPASSPDRLISARELTHGMDPDKTARVLGLSRQSGLPPRVVESNFPEIERRERLNDQMLQAIVQDAPGVADLLSDPDNFAVAQDDIDNLAALEGALRQYNPTQGERFARKWTESKEQMGDAFRGFVQGAFASFNQLVDTGEIRSQPDDTDPNDVDQWKYQIVRFMRGLTGEVSTHLNAVDAEQRKKRPAPLLPADNVVAQYAEDFVGSAAPILGTMAVSAALGPAAGATFMGTQIAGSDYIERTEKGADPLTAYASGLTDAALQAPLEYIGLDRLGRIFQATGLGNIVKRTLTALGAEASTEFLQAFPADFTEQLALQPDTGSALQEFVDNLPETAKQGLYEGLLAAPWALIGGGGRIMTDLSNLRASEREQTILDELDKGVASSLLAQRDPVLFQEAMRLFKAGGAVENIYIPAEAVRTNRGANPEALYQTLESLGVPQEVYASALEHGGDLAVPVERYAATVAADNAFAATFQNDRKLTEEGLTRNEAVRFQQEFAGEMERVALLAREEVEAQTVEDAEIKEIIADVTAQRQATGRAVEAIKSDAIALAAGFSSFAKLAGTTPGQLYATWGPQITAGGQPQAEAFSQAAEMAGANPGEEAEAARLWAEMGTESPYFKRWSGGARLIETGALYEGGPLLLRGFHGTGSDFAAFDLSKAQDKEGRKRNLGQGKGKFYLTGSAAAASNYAEAAPRRKLGGAPAVMPAFIRLNKPIEDKEYARRFETISGGRPLSDASFTQKERDSLISTLDKQLKKEGVDGIVQIYRDKTGQVAEIGQIAAFSPAQIKSVFNRGTFDPNDPRILNQSAETIDPLQAPEAAPWSGETLELDGGTAPAGEVVQALSARRMELEKLVECLK